MDKKYIVYKHTSPINKVYIGITCQKPKKRWRYGYGYVKCTYFYKAIKKYGWNNIKHEILYQNLTEEEAKQKEIELIQLYDSTNVEKGYNSTKGGDGNFGVLFTEERKKKISNAKKGHIVTEETKQKIRESQSGMKHWNFGRKISQETKDKISKAHKGFTPWNKGIPMKEDVKQKLIESSNKKSVLCVETNIEYKSIREAYRKTNINYNHISEVCKGKRKTAGGYNWELIGGVR